jgi:nitrogen fixation NifU-like protein
MDYSDKALERFKDPKHAGELPDADGAGQEGNMKCGDVMRIFIKVKGNRISDITFQTYGCVAAISTTDMLCELAKGKTLDEAEKITAREVIDKLGGVPQVKYHCSMMGRLALKRAIEDARKKGAAK